MHPTLTVFQEQAITAILTIIVIFAFTAFIVALVFGKQPPKKVLYTPPAPSALISPTLKQMSREYEELLIDIRLAATIPELFSLTDIVIDWQEGYKPFSRGKELYLHLMDELNIRERELRLERQKVKQA